MKNSKVTPKTGKYQTLIMAPLLLLVLTLMSTKCEKEKPEPTLPPATQTGANTFGCKVNGKVYIPNGNIYYPPIDQPSYHTNDGSFWIRTRNLDDFENEQNHWLYIYIYKKWCLSDWYLPRI